jgi:hypothetical protein
MAHSFARMPELTTRSSEVLQITEIKQILIG